MTTSLFICFIFIYIVSASSSPETDYVILQYSDCFEKYLHHVIRINRNYKNSLKYCNEENNINRRSPQQLDADAEMEKHKQTSREACSNLINCNLITDFVGFFSCHSKNAEQNVNKFVIMQLNASSVITELSDQYDQKEKETLRCQLGANREYFSDSSTIYKEHLNCLNTFKRKYLGNCDLLTQK